MRRIEQKGASLPLTLINTVYYDPYLFFKFSVAFFKPRTLCIMLLKVLYALILNSSLMLLCT